MENPSLQIGDNNWAVKDGSILGYNIIQDNYLPQPIDFTRASTATRVNAEGLIETSPYNLLQQSNTFTVSWGLSGTALTSGQAGYDGSSDAWLLSKDAVVNRYIFQYLSVSETKTFSVYAKANTLNNVRLYSTTGTSSTADFSLVDGSLLASVNILGSSSEDLGAGWWRFSITTDGTTSLFRIYPDPNGTTAGSIYIQDAQVNIGSTAKPYFPTTDRLNIPRIDYTGGGFGKLLLEPQRTNLVTYSEQFDNAAWNKANVTITANSVTSPSGYQDADLILTSTTLSLQKYAIQTRSVSVGSYTASFFVKANTYGSVAVISLIGGSINISYFNITSGTTGTTSAGTTSTIEDYGNGWYRITQTATETTSASRIVGIYFANSALNSISYSGSLSDSFYVWGAQLEAGSYATSYIPTLASSVTRLADAIPTKDITSFSIGNSYTILISAELNALENNRVFFTGKTSASTDSFSLRNVIGQLRLYNTIDSSYPLTSYSSSTNKWVLKIDGTSYKIFYYGGSAASTFTTARNFGKFNFEGSSTELKMQNLIIFPSALSDAECITLTL